MKTIKSLLNSNSKEGRLLHITHNDTDAVGCVLVMSYTGIEMERVFCNAGAISVDKAIEKYFFKDDSYLNYDGLLISDVMCSDVMAERLSNLCDEKDIALELFDHHKTNHLNEHYEWAHVQVTDGDGIAISATKILYNEMIDYIDERVSPILNRVADNISRYDTWEWKKHPKCYDEEDYNILVHQVGLEEASATLKAQIDMCSSEGDDKFVFSQAQRYLIDSYKRRRETMLEKVGSRAKKAPILINNKMYKAIIFIPDEEFGNAESEKLYRDYPDMDFVVALYPKNRALSFRASESSTTDVSVIAASLGGGGHEKAAGASLSTDDFIKWLRVYYDYKDEQE